MEHAATANPPFLTPSNYHTYHTHIHSINTIYFLFFSSFIVGPTCQEMQVNSVNPRADHILTLLRVGGNTQ